ncbi:Fanconi anemia group D2 protein [Amyelois transitella]|uniref:Fanconi anemia group D2 protein n=1 Tax=Amyelois transitella TaxID=680683 RepID=UPI0029904524|nr:Fanconi anemia group D2 protein [Amyelois transitella]
MKSFNRNSKRARLSEEHEMELKNLTTFEETQKVVMKETLLESGLALKNPPEKCVASQESIHIVRNVKKNLENHVNYPRNVSSFFNNLECDCRNLDLFKHYLFPNIVRITGDSPEEHHTNDSVFKILLNIPILQTKIIDLLFDRAINLAAQRKCGPWIQMIMKCLSSVDNIINTEKVSTQLINLLDVTSEKMVRLEIISAIPDIIGDKEHSNIATEMGRILSEDYDLIPAILDCVSYLCLSDDQYEQLQKKTLNILGSLSKCAHLPVFVKFLLIPGRMSDAAYLETVQEIRNTLGWPTTVAKPQDIASSQVLTATAIRTSMVSSKAIAGHWMKVVASCKVHTDHKPIDFIILLILSTVSEEKQKQVENVIRKQIKLDILKEELMDECFQKYKPILKHHIRHLIKLNNSILKTKGDPTIESFGSHIYSLMLSELDENCRTLVAELLQLGLDCKHCLLSILLILNNVASKDMYLLKAQSVQMLTLLDRMDDMNIVEIRAVMNLLCGLAYTYENSVIRDDMHMIIRKELGSSSPRIKIQGILAGTHAIKYLMASTNNDLTTEFPDDVSYGSVIHLSEGDLREAAQIIELISRSTRQFPDMIAFFYDELSKVIETASHINKQFLAWLTDAVTNDLQQNFIVDTIEKERIADLKLTMQYCLNAESEMDEVIAINIGGLVLQSKNEINVGILSPLFQLVQTLHFKQHDGNLSNIDALLGCPIVMPKYDIDLIEDMEPTTVSNILDCLIHCVNWFRELLNAFSVQNDEALRTKILNRVLQVEELENIIGQILLKTKISYKPPICTFNINKYTGEQVVKKPIKIQIAKQKMQKKPPHDDSVLPETAKSQGTQNQNPVKNKLEALYNIPLRSLNLNLLQLLKTELTSDEDESELTIKTLKFILKCINDNLESILISKIKRKTFLSKPDDSFSYDPKKAEECAKSVSEVLPKIAEHLTFIVSNLESNLPAKTIGEKELTSEIIDCITNLELIYKFYTIYFKWIGFRNHHNALLKSSLRSIAPITNTDAISLKDLIISVAKFFEKHQKYCLQLSTAVALIDFIKSIQTYSDNTEILKIVKDMAQRFLSEQWKTIDGVPEKGLIFNQSLDTFASTYFLNHEILALRSLTLQLTNDIKLLKGRNDKLNSFKSITKNNFAILYRNLGSAVHEAAKARLTRGLSNSEHLDLWKDVAVILKHMSDIAKTLENRNNLSVFFKKSLPILKLFMSQGIPILEIQLKTETEEVLEILKILQQSTRFLQSLCCHSRLKKDTVLMSKVPYMRELLETLIYKVKAALAANNCSEAFWMGNLKNKDIHGEIIATQQSIESEESVEDGDEQLPEDDDSDDTDDEMLNPDSKSISDIV